MNLQYRIDLLSRLGEYMASNDENWQQAKEKASWENGWFIPEFVQTAVTGITQQFLQKDLLEAWAAFYRIADNPLAPKLIGIVMAGNIPLVGFHDFLCGFISGHKLLIKASTKDNVLIKHLVDTLIEWDAATSGQVNFSESLKSCDAYIATGSNNTAGYFEYYFKRFPNIIRKNRTSIAILDGNETTDELSRLADDVYRYFGLGCRNVTKIYVPEGYDFIPLLEAFKKYTHLSDHHKYKNNLDYNLAIHILNKKYYMSNGSILLVEDPSFFSPISQLNYEFYAEKDKLSESLTGHPSLQAIVGNGFISFGKSQSPSLTDYADGVDTLAFVSHL